MIHLQKLYSLLNLYYTVVIHHTIHLSHRMNRKVILFIAMSLDGYIAKPDDDLSFLSVVEKEGEDYGYEAFVKNTDTVIMGRKTYEWVLKHAEFPHKEKAVYILTKSQREDTGNIHFYNDDLRVLIQRLKSEQGKNIYCDGGADTANALFREGLIDEMVLSIIPIMVGEGVRLFKNGIPEQKLTLQKTVSYSTGLVQLHYSKTTVK